MQTQRLEAERNRRNQEVNRRNQEKTTNKVLDTWQARREIARSFSQQFLSQFKQENLTFLTSIGQLRDNREYQFNADFLPKFYTQIAVDYHGFDERQEELN